MHTKQQGYQVNYKESVNKMHMNIQPDFFRVIAVSEPTVNKAFMFIVGITLENMKGEQQHKEIIFSSQSEAFSFYVTQSKMLKDKKR